MLRTMFVPDSRKLWFFLNTLPLAGNVAQLLNPSRPHPRGSFPLIWCFLIPVNNGPMKNLLDNGVMLDMILMLGRSALFNHLHLCRLLPGHHERGKEGARAMLLPVKGNTAFCWCFMIKELLTVHLIPSVDLDYVNLFWLMRFSFQQPKQYSDMKVYFYIVALHLKLHLKVHIAVKTMYRLCKVWHDKIDIWFQITIF